MKNDSTKQPDHSEKLNKANGKHVHILTIILLSLLLFAGQGWAQTTVFYDDFNRAPVSPGGVPEMIYASTNTGAGSSFIDGTLATGTVPYLKIANGNPAGRSYVTGTLSTFSVPFNTTLSANAGPVSWTFNIRHSRGGGTVVTLGGFSAGAYGIATVLAATEANLLSATCNGYAVVMGAPSSGSVYNLIKFTGGLTSNSNVTTIVTGTLPSMTAPNNLRDYMSIKVTYDPITSTWKLYERVDGLSASPTWVDPTTVTEANLIGSAVDNTYTGTPMSTFGYFWNYSTSSGINAFFDNFGVAVTPVVTPTLSVTPNTLSGFSYVSGSGPSTSQSYSISGINLDGSAITVTGSTDYYVSTNNIDFSGSTNFTYSGSTLPSTPVYVRLKAGLPTGNYNLETISNSGGGADAATVTCSGFVVSPPTSYTWTGATDNDWQIAGNWNPERTVPAINDILQFNDAGTYTITNVPTQTVGQIQVTGGSKITLQASVVSTLTVAGETGEDLSVAGGTSELNISGTFALTLSLNNGSTGLVYGSMTVSGGAHAVKATGTYSLIFSNGSMFKATTGFTGNAFGAANINTVKFQAGSTYVQDAGSNPFGAGQPSSVVNFETGSLYKFTTPSGGPSYSGRTYANFENDSPLSTQNNQGSSPMTCDNYTVTSGIVNWDFSGGLVIRGNISVSSAATLTFGNATKATNLTLGGTAVQMISGSGILAFGGNSTITVNNLSGITLSRDITANNLVFQSGIITTGSNTLSMASTGAITGAGTGKYVNGNLSLSIPAGAPSVSFAIGDASNYTPVILDFTGVTSAGTLTASTTAGLHPNSATSGLNLAKCVNRYWSLTNNTSAFASYDATFTFVPGDILGGGNPDNFIMMKWDSPAWSSTTTGTRTATTTKITGLTSFSDFMDGEAGCINPLVYNVTGGGLYCAGGLGAPVYLSGSETGVNYQLFVDGLPSGLPVAGNGGIVSFGDQLLAGIYTVSGTHAVSGCSSTMNGSVTIAIIPTVPVSVTLAASANPVTAGTLVTFTATPVNGGVSPSYMWLVNNIVISGATGSAYSYIPVNNDEVVCVMTSDMECPTGNPATSNAIVMTVINVPVNQSVSGTISSGQTVCYNAIQTVTVAGGSTEFIVNDGGSATMIAGQNILYLQGTKVLSGGYMHGYIAPEGPYCGGLMPLPIAVKSGTEENPVPDPSSFFRVYPNPTAGSFTLELTRETTPGTVKVEAYGMQGERVLNATLSGELKHTFSLDGRHAGCYFIRVTSDDKTGATKIIKQ